MSVFPTGCGVASRSFAVTGAAVCLTDLNRLEEAEPQLLEAYDGELAMRGAQHCYTREAVANLVHLYEQWYKPEQAERWRTALP